jgi:hypothetical protein
VLLQQQVWCQGIPCGTYGGQSGAGAGFSLSALVFSLLLEFHNYFVLIFHLSTIDAIYLSS